jgi:hypothetical protein
MHREVVISGTHASGSMGNLPGRVTAQVNPTPIHLAHTWRTHGTHLAVEAAFCLHRATEALFRNVGAVPVGHELEVDAGSDFVVKHARHGTAVKGKARAGDVF